MVKQWILRWLGVPKMLEAQQAAYAGALAAQQTAYQAELANKTNALRAELEFRSGLVLEASIIAADKISRMVASQGDSNLREYVDSCFTVFQEQTFPTELTN